MTQIGRHRERRMALGGVRPGGTRRGEADLRLARAREVAATITGVPGHTLNGQQVKRIIAEARRQYPLEVPRT